MGGALIILGLTSKNVSVEGSRRERREQWRWERRMRRQLRALDRAATAGPGLRRAAKPRRTTGPVLPGLLISGILAALVMLHDPGMTGYRFRQLTDHLTGNGGGSYAFVVTTSDGDPVGWDHCKPIHYVVNPAGAPDEWEDIIRGGVAAITDASGFEFQYDGTSIERSLHRAGRRRVRPAAGAHRLGELRPRCPTSRAPRPVSAAARRRACASASSSSPAWSSSTPTPTTGWRSVATGGPRS